MSAQITPEAWNDIQEQGCLSRSHLTSLMYDTNALPECNPKMPEQEMFGVAVSLTTARPLLARIAELEREVEALRKDAELLDYIESNARCDPKMDGMHVWWPTTFNHRLIGPNLRAAIDAALQEQSKC